MGWDKVDSNWYSVLLSVLSHTLYFYTRSYLCRTYRCAVRYYYSSNCIENPSTKYISHIPVIRRPPLTTKKKNRQKNPSPLAPLNYLELESGVCLCIQQCSTQKKGSASSFVLKAIKRLLCNKDTKKHTHTHIYGPSCVQPTANRHTIYTNVYTHHEGQKGEKRHGDQTQTSQTATPTLPTNQPTEAHLESDLEHRRV